MIHTTIEFARSIPEDIAEQCTQDHFADLPDWSCLQKPWYDPIWQGYFDWRNGGEQPRRARLSAETVNIDVNISDNDNAVEFRALSPEFAEESGHIDSDARWVNVLKLNDYGQQTSLAITYLPNTKNHGFPRLGLSRSTIISREGIVLPQRYTQVKPR